MKFANDHSLIPIPFNRRVKSGTILLKVNKINLVKMTHETPKLVNKSKKTFFNMFLFYTFSFRFFFEYSELSSFSRCKICQATKHGKNVKKTRLAGNWKTVGSGEWRGCLHKSGEKLMPSNIFCCLLWFLYPISIVCFAKKKIFFNFTCHNQMSWSKFKYIVGFRSEYKILYRFCMLKQFKINDKLIFHVLCNWFAIPGWEWVTLK